MAGVTMKGSMNFVWDLQNVLGHGATSVVYMGRSKRTFHKVAVKVFSPASFNRPISIQTREFEVMKKLNHKNIVQLLAIEDENQTYNKVIVMEYCAHGSLFNLLEESKNRFGLPEEEVLLVLQHVASGMKHLRSNAVVHRDVKPGNILRCIDPDGRSVYKLTDFGAARELQDQEQFISLYGTEEYLHPHMYEKAVLRRDNSKIFDASVDLWSIGVTYYHMATGNLPFRPFGGRRDKELMYKIVSQKERGVISGIQLKANDPIIWNRVLPNTCTLSQGLQIYLIPLLASLLEINPDHMWTFETYFETVDSLCSKSVVHAYCPNMSSSLKIYLNTEDSLSKLHENITKQTDIEKENQLLLFENRHIEAAIDSLLTVKNYPDNITVHNPIFIFNKIEEFHAYPDPGYIAPFPLINDQPHANLELDYRTARECCRIGHSVQAAISTIVQQNKLQHLAVKQYSIDLNQGIQTEHSNLDHVTQFCETTKAWFRKFIKIISLQINSIRILFNKNPVEPLQELITRIEQIQTEAMTEFDSRTKQIQALLEELRLSIKKLTTSHLEAKQLTMEWKFTEGCLSVDRCPEILNQLVIKLEESTMTLKENRAKRILPYNDEQIHKYERLEIKKISEEIKKRLTTHCCPRAHDLYNAYQVWYRKATDSRRESAKNKTRMKNLIQLQSSFYDKFNELMQCFISVLDDGAPDNETKSLMLVASQSFASASVNDTKKDESMRRQVAGDILDGLKTTRSSVEEMVQLVKENNTIIERFGSLSSLPEEWD
ncbi:serine/threonine-protein kinase TBK1 isoform X1 [Patella vulgata]|uniref:serine/threonine-protein kinase TBK1 isoform X1 n=2 Tax=Patella vulgata TaxID=6465 RepID=UPI00217FCD9C|nr:serine/threonine-protein kinase TBK1 isoform X1 [Patella vulgata]XP_050414743.1 serine/threonine-protein kinase TBK1 isoform X1 [Patella vulgata]XP_050414744.1 serine/threonine-protein kinase TBK1 isoform X1 [Patella vulgata]